MWRKQRKPTQTIILKGEQVTKFFKNVKVDNKPEEKHKPFMFQLSDEQSKKYYKWVKSHKCKLRKDGIRYVGAVGGADTFHIIGTGIGYIVEVECSCGSKLDLTEDF